VKEKLKIFAKRTCVADRSLERNPERRGVERDQNVWQGRPPKRKTNRVIVETRKDGRGAILKASIKKNCLLLYGFIERRC